MNRLTRRKYLALLIALGLLIVAFPILRATTNTRLLLDVLFSLVFGAALFSVFTDRSARVGALLLGVPTIVGVWTGYILPGIPRLPLALGLHLSAALFFAFMTSVILRDIHQSQEVTPDNVHGAFCGYLLIGLAFGHVYSLVEFLTPGAFQGEGFSTPRPSDHHFLLTYFSFLTLTTVGYGDVTPGCDTARGLAVVEAITGQFYLAVLVAELIGKRVSQAVTDRPDPPT